MTAGAWWSHLDPEVQRWLIDNNGDSVPAAIAEHVVRAGGTAIAGEPLSDADVDWIEAVANDESPD
jgi:hypothetical protein